MPELTLFQRRWSCRAYTSRPVPTATVERLLEAAIWAPTAGNLQPWRFLVVRQDRLKKALAVAAHGQAFIRQAPVVIVACALELASGHRYGDRGRRLYCLQDTAAACQNILLAATAEGLASCWVGAFDEGLVAKNLSLHSSWRPVAILTIGEAAERAGTRSRDSLEHVVRWLD